MELEKELPRVVDQINDLKAKKAIEMKAYSDAIREKDHYAKKIVEAIKQGKKTLDELNEYSA